MRRALIILLVVATVVLGALVGQRIYQAAHCRGGLYCGCPGVSCDP